LDLISDELMKASQNVVAANDNIDDANELQKKARKKYIFLVTLLILIIIVVAGVIFFLTT
jgi:t-SNARE complex subunit (syntaxin)